MISIVGEDPQPIQLVEATNGKCLCEADQRRRMFNPMNIDNFRSKLRKTCLGGAGSHPACERGVIASRTPACMHALTVCEAHVCFNNHTKTFGQPLANTSVRAQKAFVQAINDQANLPRFQRCIRQVCMHDVQLHEGRPPPEAAVHSRTILRLFLSLGGTRIVKKLVAARSWLPNGRWFNYKETEVWVPSVGGVDRMETAHLVADAIILLFSGGLFTEFPSLARRGPSF